MTHERRPQRPTLQPAGLSVSDAAASLSLGVRTVRRLIANGELRHVRIGARVVIPQDAIDELLRHHPHPDPIDPTDLAAMQRWLAEHPPPELTDRQRDVIVSIIRAHYAEQADADRRRPAC